ncbi:hypothetical protein A2U01_0086191 [Trifolium medium]|uniref:Uncharacterized protein n=1 Tax=Trifolium medium TaxID=97028 RepID=A0A392TUU8_9FABA|nr:hypothetical protein [Trifolium medium]
MPAARSAATRGQAARSASRAARSAGRSPVRAENAFLTQKCLFEFENDLFNSKKSYQA